MSFIPALIIGTSLDGPDGTPYLPTSLSDLKNTFGWYINKSVDLVPATSGFTTAFPVWGNEITSFVNTNYRLIPNALYNLQASGTSVTFGNIGVSGNYRFKYIKAPEEGNLVVGAEIYTQQSGNLPYVLRVPGTKATLTLGPYYFEAQASGEIYNGITLTVSGNNIVISCNSLSLYSPLTYSITDPYAFTAAINSDNAKRKLPITASYYPSIFSSLTNGTYTLTGGASGSLNSSNVSSILDLLDIDDIGFIVFASGLDQGTISAISSYMIAAKGLAVAVVGDPVAMMSGSMASYASFLQGLNYSGNNLIYVGGWGTHKLNEGLPLNSTLGPTLTGLWTGNSPVHKSAKLIDMYPLWDQSNTDSVSLKYCIFNKFIQTGIGPYKAFTLSGQSPTNTKVKINVAASIQDALDGLIGRPILSVLDIYNTVERVLSSLQGIKDRRHSVSINRNIVNIVIDLLLYGEVEYIQVDINSRRPLNG